MQNNHKNESLALFLLVAAFVMVIDYMALRRLSHGIVLAIFIHLLVVASLAAWVYYRHSKKKNRRFSILLLLMTATTGPFGAGVCMLTALMSSYCATKATHPSEWITALFSQEEEEDALYERLQLGLDNVDIASGVEPFQDILQSGTMLQKQVTIAKITRYFQPQFAPLLLHAAHDPNAAVRVQAAAALAKIERNFMSEYIELEKSLKDTPYYDTAWLKLAKVYEEYAQAGLLDEYSLNVVQLKAIKIYELYLAFNKDQEIQMFLAKMYMKQNQPEKANKLLGEIIKSSTKTSPIVIFWYLESLFRLQKFSELRVVAKRYVNELSGLDNRKYGVDLDTTLRLWRADNTINTKPVLEKNYGI